VVGVVGFVGVVLVPGRVVGEFVGGVDVVGAVGVVGAGALLLCAHVILTRVKEIPPTNNPRDTLRIRPPPDLPGLYSRNCLLGNPLPNQKAKARRRLIPTGLMQRDWKGIQKFPD